MTDEFEVFAGGGFAKDATDFFDDVFEVRIEAGGGDGAKYQRLLPVFAPAYDGFEEKVIS